MEPINSSFFHRGIIYLLNFALLSPFLLLVVTPTSLFAQTNLTKLAEVAWVHQEGLFKNIYYSSYRSNRWSTAVLVSNEAGLHLKPSLASGEGNRTWVVWPVLINGTEIKLFFAIIDNDNSVTKPVEIHTGMRSNTSPIIAIDSYENPWIVWSGNNGNEQDDIFYSSWNGTNWNKPVQVNEKNEVPDILPQFVHDSSGTMIVKWKTFSEVGYIEKSKIVPESKVSIQKGYAVTVKPDQDLFISGCVNTLPPAVTNSDQVTLFQNCLQE